MSGSVGKCLLKDWWEEKYMCKVTAKLMASSCFPAPTFQCTLCDSCLHKYLHLDLDFIGLYLY